MQIALRPALVQDFEYCKRVYFHEMERIIQKLHLDRASQLTSFKQYWAPTAVRIITLDDLDVGWLQSSIEDDGLFIAQLFVEGPFQGRGIGTEVMSRLIADALHANQAVVLAVVKINPALRLYERLGFHITDEDDRKYYLKRDPVPLR